MTASRVRRLLRRSPLVAGANARIKAAATRRAYDRLATDYLAAARKAEVSADEPRVIAALRERLRTRLGPPPRGHRPLQIFWVGANRPQDDSGFLQALRRAGQVRTFENCEGSYGLLFRGASDKPRLFDPQLIAKNDRSLLTQVEDAFRTTGVDLLMGQMWANYVSAKALHRVQHMGVVTVNVAMDDRQPDQWDTYRGTQLGSVGLKAGLDLVLTTASECCAWYAVEGCPALFWPLASDPELFKPVSETDKRYDMSFIGTRYGLRGRLVEALQSAGVPIAAFGHGWPNGPVGVEDAARIFSESRMILGVATIGHNEDLFAMKLRDFDATMSGALYFTHRHPDLLRLFAEGREIVCYDSIDDCIAKVKHYLTHPAERIAIAAAGAERARASHTWDQRLAYVVSVLEMGRAAS